MEDSRNGILAARNAGMKALLVPDMVAPDATMLSSATAVFPDLFAVQRWLVQQEYPEKA